MPAPDDSRPHFTYYTASSLDGFLADDADSLDWLLTQPLEESGPMNYQDFIAGIGTMVMGATTYQWVVDHETGTDDAGVTRPWPYDIPAFVFTHRPIRPIAPTIEVIESSPAEHLDRIVTAAAGRGVWIVGGGDLAAQFADAGLLDEIVVMFAPVTLGSGRPLFTRPYDLELREVDRNGAFLCARYRVVGART